MRRVVVTFASCLLLSLGCAGQALIFQSSPQLPAVDAEARVEVDQNENRLVEIDVRHMAQASRLSPPRVVYVVWAEGDEGRPLPLGQLRVDESRQGRFRGVTALERFRILITAEYEPQPDRPSEPYMLVSDFIQPASER